MPLGSPTVIPTTSIAHSAVTGQTATDHHTAPVEATQAQMEAETAGDTRVPPDLVRHSPGVAKVVCSWLGNGTIQAGSYNMTSSARNSVGNYTLTYDTDFTDLDYTPGATAEGGENLTVTVSSPAAGTSNVFVWDDASSDNKADAITHFWAWGDQ